ncbi:hypothetical protein [Mucilaginibacter glaciei]|uniref:Lipoprotein n=1 Tax=Mucilaginibacter glaciei TaxID=2772109 RepID=A0A926NR99_9SPHI|nr:hypothetical protein [Mucilaginibacter glaciei]MBD1392445.1 hypothetical protein [Mucilaginibacter glaciei]
MKNDKIRLLLIIIPGVILFGGCEGKIDKQKAPFTHKDSVIDKKKSKTLVNNDNIVPDGNTRPYKEVDSLMELIKQNYKVVVVQKLEKICVKSDGDLSEYLDDVGNKLFNDHLNEFTDYLIDNPNSCLKGKLIEEISSELYVYPKSERPGKLLEEEEKVLASASKQKLSSKKMAFIKEIFKNVNPDLLD